MKEKRSQKLIIKDKNKTSSEIKFAASSGEISFVISSITDHKTLRVASTFLRLSVLRSSLLK